MPETRFLTDLGLLFLAALGGGLLAQAVHQPLIVGYILAGVLIGPFTPGPTLSDPHTFQLFADVGVVLLMFTIGVEFSVEELLRVRKVALLGAPAGIALVALLTIPVGKLLGWTLVQSLVAGAAVSVASTMVLLKFLLERGELATLYGRVVVGITLAEDLAVVAMTVLIPALASPGGDRAAALGQALLEAVVLLGPLLWLARRAVPLLLAKVAHTRNMELFLLVALAVAIGTAALTAGLGLSIALGAFLAGLVISESEFAHEALARVLPVRDIFVAIFFVSIGTLIRPASLLAAGSAASEGKWPTRSMPFIFCTLLWTWIRRPRARRGRGVPVRSSGTPAAKACCTMPGWTVPSWRWWRSLSSRQPAGVSRPCGRSDPISPFWCGYTSSATVRS